jgi:AraC-like DNA-binding protein
MDILSDILQQAGLRRRLLDLHTLPAEGALQFPCERSIGFHVVLQGPVYIHTTADVAPLQLQGGDIALMARGCHHVLASGPVLPSGPLPRALPMPAGANSGTENGDERGSAPAVVSAAWQLWHAPLHPLFAELPAWHVLRADTLPRLSPLPLTVALLGAEVREHGLGAQTIIHGLFDAAFALLLREVVAQLGRSGAGFSHALADARVRRAVELMHTDTARPWTLESLARAVGLSRTALAQKFRAALGDTPLNYLRLLRMQQAMRLLTESTRSLDAVATEVGYQDAFSFSKVFKRTVGVAPRDFRRQDMSLAF